MGNNSDLDEIRAPRGTPRGTVVSSDIGQGLISSPALWQEASGFAYYIRAKGLFDCMGAPANDVRWVIFFTMIARYFEDRDLRLLITDRDGDVPF